MSLKWVSFEDYLIDKHAEQYNGLDDEMPDDYERWLSELDIYDVIQWANKWGETIERIK